MTARIDALRIGQRVDLEGDAYADPLLPGLSTHPEFEFEYEVVLEIERETLDCIRIDFESGFSCGFSPDHVVTVDNTQRMD